MTRTSIKTIGILALAVAAVAGCDDKKSNTNAPVPSAPAPAQVTPAQPTTKPSTTGGNAAAPTTPAQNTAVATPAVKPEPKLPPDSYAIPWVTVVELPAGKDIRVKIKQSLSTIDMVKIPGGTVELPAVGPGGKIDPSKKQTVQVKSFWIGKTEVPWDLYDVWYYHKDLVIPEEDMKLEEAETPRPKDTWSRPSKVYNDPSYGFGREGYPAISIHPHAAKTFCKWLSAHTGKKYRLATEAEWILACRGGKPEAQMSKEDLGKAAWYLDNAMNDSMAMETTHKIGTKAPNGYGLLDILGNAAEWVIGADGKYVLKGGSYLAEAKDVNCLSRIPYDIDTMQMRDPQWPKSTWWLSDGPNASFRIVREDE